MTNLLDKFGLIVEHSKTEVFIFLGHMVLLTLSYSIYHT